MEHVFRSTVTASKPRLGRRMVVQGRESSLAVVGAGVSEAAAAPRERAATGRGHVQFSPSSAAGLAHSMVLGDGGVAQASDAGAKPLSRPAGQHAGGKDHIDFSFGAADGDTCAPCSLKEFELRAALEPSARAAAAAQVGAGARVEQRARRTEGAPGGIDNVALGVFGGSGGGTSEYKESVAGAQARLALDPRVREDAAGGRAAAAPSMPLKPLPHAHSFANLLTEAPPAADFDAGAHAAKTLRRMAPAPPPALPPFATAYDGAASAPPPTHTTGRARPPRVIIDVAARGAPQQRSMPAHLSSTYVFG